MSDLPFATPDTRPPRGYPGMPSDIGYKYDRSYSNSASDVAPISTVTVGTYVAGATYSLSVNGSTVNYQAPASGGTATTARNSLIESVNLLGGVYAQVGAGANDLKITGQPGVPMSLSATATGGGAITAASTQAVVTSGDIKLGLAVVQVAGDEKDEARVGAPDANHRFVGVTIDNGFMRQGCNEVGMEAVYRRQDFMTVREIGRCFVRVTEPVTTQDKVYYFYSGPAATLGYFTPTTGTGADIEILNARWVENSSGGFAELYLGAPALMTATVTP